MVSADISAATCACFPHFPAAAVTEKQTRQRTKFPLLVTLSSADRRFDFTNLIPQLLRNDRFMVVLNDRPFRFITVDALMVFVAHRCCAELSERPDIYRIFQDIFEISAAPQMRVVVGIRLADTLVIVVKRCQHSFFIQDSCDLQRLHAACIHLKDSADDSCGIRINDRSTHLIIALNITVWAIGSHHLACLCISGDNSPDLLGSVCSVPFVEHITDRHHIHICTIGIERINSVVQCDETDIVHRKNIVRVLTYLNVISSETGEVFADDKIDPAVFRIVKHSLHTRSVERCSADTVINVLIIDRPALFTDIVVEDSSLVFYGKGFACTFIIF